MEELTAKQEDFLLEEAREKAVELKTLQDLNINKTGKTMIVPMDILRAEAVKWVKEIQPEALLNIKDVKDNMIVDWIKHFFNLKEEDLA